MGRDEVIGTARNSGPRLRERRGGLAKETPLRHREAHTAKEVAQSLRQEPALGKGGQGGLERWFTKRAGRKKTDAGTWEDPLKPDIVIWDKREEEGHRVGGESRKE